MGKSRLRQKKFPRRRPLPSRPERQRNRLVSPLCSESKVPPWGKSAVCFDLLKFAGYSDDNGETSALFGHGWGADSLSYFQGLRRLSLTLVLAASTLGTLAAFFQKCPHFAKTQASGA